MQPHKLHKTQSHTQAQCAINDGKCFNTPRQMAELEDVCSRKIPQNLPQVLQEEGKKQVKKRVKSWKRDSWCWRTLNLSWKVLVELKEKGKPRNWRNPSRHFKVASKGVFDEGTVRRFRPNFRKCLEGFEVFNQNTLNRGQTVRKRYPEGAKQHNAGLPR